MRLARFLQVGQGCLYLHVGCFVLDRISDRRNFRVRPGEAGPEQLAGNLVDLPRQAAYVVGLDDLLRIHDFLDERLDHAPLKVIGDLQLHPQINRRTRLGHLLDLGGIGLANPLLDLANSLLELLGQLLELGGVHLPDLGQELAEPLLELSGVGIAATGVLSDDSEAVHKDQGRAQHN